jgi:hypothetical protein
MVPSFIFWGGMDCVYTSWAGDCQGFFQIPKTKFQNFFNLILDFYTGRMYFIGVE